MKKNPPAKYLVEPVKFFVALLYRNTEPLDHARKKLIENYGEEDHVSQAFPFSHTSYYEQEMGAPLFRLFVSYRKLLMPDKLLEAKLLCTRLEEELSDENSQRRINIDPGILDYQKVVLASFKFQGQKIYLGRNVWADLTLYYRKGGWSAFEWTFPDFKANTYHKTLLEIRQLYKENRQAESTDNKPC